MSERNFKRLNMIRLPEVIKRSGLSKPSIYRHQKLGTFPKSRKIGDRAVGWIESEIDEWVESCMVIGA